MLSELILLLFFKCYFNDFLVSLSAAIANFSSLTYISALKSSQQLQVFFQRYPNKVLKLLSKVSRELIKPTTCSLLHSQYFGRSLDLSSSSGKYTLDVSFRVVRFSQFKRFHGNENFWLGASRHFADSMFTAAMHLTSIEFSQMLVHDNC